MRTGWFIGRFQPFHKGHQAMIEKILEECGECVVLVRQVKRDKNNPHTAEEVKETIHKWAVDKFVHVVTVPDKDCDMTVYYGRKVGWNFKEIRLDKEVEDISATELRKKVAQGAKLAVKRYGGVLDKLAAYDHLDNR